ncbi:ankyrin repeat domain-containing protein 50-like [Centruroides vittatus]|uniref:ankyrin repeat domain-containing protein 50-like n=1 Tax=Centruroides vittatus TaxID=120091 RepID=UPI00350ECC7A
MSEEIVENVKILSDNLSDNAEMADIPENDQKYEVYTQTEETSIDDERMVFPEYQFACKKHKLTQFPPEEIKVNVSDSDRKVALLHQAIQKNNVDQVRELLDSGVDPDAQDISTGKLPLIEATNKGYSNIVKALLIAHADVNRTNIQGTTALHVSVDAKNFNKEIPQLFLERRKANYNIQDKVQQNTPLHILARVVVSMKHSKQETMLDLLEDMIPRCDLNLKNKNGNTALHILAQGKRDDEDAVRIFLNRKPDINSQNQLGETPLATAIDHGNLKMASIILDHDIDLTIRDRCEYTFLHYAAKKNAPKIVKKLLEKGADPNAQDPYGDTALHIAAGRGFHEVVFELIQNPNIELDKQNEGGYTPLLCAVDSGFLKVVKILVEAGCDRNIISRDTNKTIMDIAEEQTKRNKRDIYDYLKSLEKKESEQESSVTLSELISEHVSVTRSEAHTPKEVLDIVSPEDKLGVISPQDEFEREITVETPEDKSAIISPKDVSGVSTPKETLEPLSQKEKSGESTPRKSFVISSPTDKSGIASPKDKSGASSPKDKSSVASPKDKSGAVSPKEKPGESTPRKSFGISSPTDKSGIASPKDKSGASSPKDKSSVASPKDKSGAVSPTDKSGIASPKDKSGASSPKDKSGSPIDKSGAADAATLSEKSDAGSLKSIPQIITPKDKSGTATPIMKSGTSSPKDINGVITPKDIDDISIPEGKSDTTTPVIKTDTNIPEDLSDKGELQDKSGASTPKDIIEQISPTIDVSSMEINKEKSDTSTPKRRSRDDSGKIISENWVPIDYETETVRLTSDIEKDEEELRDIEAEKEHEDENMPE